MPMQPLAAPRRSLLRSVVATALLLGGCDPLEAPESESESESEAVDQDENPCSRWEIEVAATPAEFNAIGAAVEPGELGSVRLDIVVDYATVQALQRIDLKITASTGQAVPGARLVLLQVGDLAETSQMLQEGWVAGPLGNQASFQLSLPPTECVASCHFSFLVTGDPVQSSVPVPLELTGSATLILNDDAEACPSPPQVSAFDASEASRGL